ncbi:MAG: hypothetical protein ABMA25_01560 [Ilumatobacteraceae bacterium]
MDTMTTLTKWQDDYFTMVKKVEQPMLKFVGERAETVARYLPERPAFMASMPKMTTMVDNQLRFRKRFVDEQAAFVRSMMKAMQPMLMKVDAMPTMHAADKPVAKSAATRMAPRRVTHRAA